MFRLMFTVFIALVLAPYSALSQPEFESQREFGELIQGYYLNPQPDQIGPAIEYIIETNVFKNESAAAPIVAFLAVVFSQNPSRLKAWESAINEAPEETRLTLRSAVEAAENPMKLIEDEPYLARRNDLCWGCFFASGDEKYITILIGHVAYIDDREDMDFFLGAATAKWSLASNSKSHPVVRSTIESSLETVTGAQAEHHRDMLDKPAGEIKASFVAIIREQQQSGNW